MPSPTVEDYLKQIYALARQGPGRGAAGSSEAGSGARSERVALGDVAAALDVRPGTVTSMVKRLAAERLLRYERYGGVWLTAKGERAALEVMRRHRIVETFLVRALKLDWSEVHAEAERLEHAVSDRLLARLEEFLGFPEVDPHGDPIPSADGTVARTVGSRLADAAPGDRLRIVRVLDQGRESLLSLAERGLRPGARLVVASVDRGADLVSVKVARARKPVSVSLGVATQLVVEDDDARSRRSRG